MLNLKRKLLVLSFVFLSEFMSAQCAMCKAVVEGGNSKMAEGVNNGITYLMVFPYILVGFLIYLLVKHKRKLKN